MTHYLTPEQVLAKLAESGDDEHRPQAGAPAANQFGTFVVHAASEKQTRFIAELVAERDLSAPCPLPAALEAARAGRPVNKRHASDFITWLLAQPKKAGSPSYRTASEKQVGLISRLAPERDMGQDAVEAALAASGVTRVEDLPVKAASTLIDSLFALPKAKVGPAPELESGMYVKDGTIYKVQRAVHGSGHMYAKRLVDPTHPGEKATFEYESGAIRTLTPADRMTLAQAKEYGAIYGVCCVCGATLTNEVSIEAGIGPVCGGRI